MKKYQEWLKSKAEKGFDRYWKDNVKKPLDEVLEHLKKFDHDFELFQETAKSVGIDTKDFDKYEKYFDRVIAFGKNLDERKKQIKDKIDELAKAPSGAGARAIAQDILEIMKKEREAIDQIVSIFNEIMGRLRKEE